ncbi:hypothetical protein AgCh_007283 [Apium graveolens]
MQGNPTLAIAVKTLDRVILAVELTVAYVNGNLGLLSRVLNYEARKSEEPEEQEQKPVREKPEEQEQKYFLAVISRSKFEQGEPGNKSTSLSLEGNASKKSQVSLNKKHLKLKKHEDNIKYLKTRENDLNDTILNLEDKAAERAAKIASASKRAAKEINEDNVPVVEETTRLKKARFAGLDTRGKAIEPSFLRKHKEPMVEVPAEGAEAHNAPISAAAPVSAATGAFQPLSGFRRGDIVVGSTKHAWDWSYHGVTPKDFTDVVATPDLERIKLMGAQYLASSNAYFQGAVRQAETWKRASEF